MVYMLLFVQWVLDIRLDTTVKVDTRIHISLPQLLAVQGVTSSIQPGGGGICYRPGLPQSI